jgi:hypothetical protein
MKIFLCDYLICFDNSRSQLFPHNRRFFENFGGIFYTQRFHHLTSASVTQCHDPLGRHWGLTSSTRLSLTTKAMSKYGNSRQNPSHDTVMSTLRGRRMSLFGIIQVSVSSLPVYHITLESVIAFCSFDVVGCPAGSAFVVNRVCDRWAEELCSSGAEVSLVFLHSSVS